MKVQECINCIFSSWYSNFKQITFKSRVIKLSPEFIAYLKTDGIILPDPEQVRYSNDLQGFSDDDEDGGWDSEATTQQASLFPQLKLEVESAIKQLGGSVFPKMNWSSPKDAVWITHNGSLTCSTFNDICLLLKSSDFVAHDLTNAYKHCVDCGASTDNQCGASTGNFELVLRKWVEVTSGMEFRCFVKQRRIIAISQRHHTTYYPYLQNKKQSILNEILNIFNCNIKGKFPDPDYTFDVYVDTTKTYLVDFNPFGAVTDSLLFSWDTLSELDGQIVDVDSDLFAIVTEDSGIQPSELMSHALPKDMIDLSRGEDVDKMLDFLNLRDLVCRPGESTE